AFFGIGDSQVHVPVSIEIAGTERPDIRSGRGKLDRDCVRSVSQVLQYREDPSAAIQSRAAVWNCNLGKAVVIEVGGLHLLRVAASGVKSVSSERPVSISEHGPFLVVPVGTASE